MKYKELSVNTVAESSLYFIFSPGSFCSSDVMQVSHSFPLFNIFYHKWAPVHLCDPEHQIPPCLSLSFRFLSSLPPTLTFSALPHQEIPANFILSTTCHVLVINIIIYIVLCYREDPEQLEQQRATLLKEKEAFKVCLASPIFCHMLKSVKCLQCSVHHFGVHLSSSFFM